MDMPEIKSTDTELHSDQYPFSLPLRISSFENEKMYLGFIRNCEKLIRGSLEFKLWRDYVKDILLATECCLTHETIDQVSIEIHHHIPDLFTLVKALVNKKLSSETAFSTFDISLEVIELHFNNTIGFTPLITSLHEKFHNGYLKIPIEFIMGNYTYFIENLMSYLDDEDIQKIMEKTAVRLESVGQYDWSKDEYLMVKNG